MLLRSSISTTKKFFQKTIVNLKSFFSGRDYQKLPKSAAAFDMNNLQSTSYRELDKLYTDFTDQWDSKIENIRRSSSKKAKTVTSAPVKQGLIDQVRSPVRLTNPDKDFRVTQQQQQREENVKTLSKESRKEVGRQCLVAQKLKELEMLDMSNVEHVLDIEEVLHYYSKLTCPAYLEIVDKFFMDMCVEFFGPAAPPEAAVATPARSRTIPARSRNTPARSVNTRQPIRPRSVMS